jgi:hypothetical protein
MELSDQVKELEAKTIVNDDYAPRRSQYLKISPSTVRYHMLVKKGLEDNMTWQQVARQAIDWYLLSFPPKKRSKNH